MNGEEHSLLRARATSLPQCSCRYDDDTTVKNCNDRTDCSASALAGTVHVDSHHSEASTRSQHSPAPSACLSRTGHRASTTRGLTHLLPLLPCHRPFARHRPSTSISASIDRDRSLTRGGKKAEGDDERSRTGASHALPILPLPLLPNARSTPPAIRETAVGVL